MGRSTATAGLFYFCALLWAMAMHCLAATPVLVAQWPGGNRGPIQSVQVRSNIAYCATAQGGLSILNIGNPTNAFWVGGYDTSGSALDVAITGNVACVADYNAGMQVIDVTDPSNPTRLGGYSNCDRVKGVAVSGNYAYLADGTNGLDIIDLSAPASPERIGRYAPTNGFAEGIAVSGNFAYLAMGTAGLFVVDISNPTLPVKIGCYDTTGYAQRVAVSGNYAYVADGVAGLQVVDISNPSTPTRAGGYSTNTFVTGVAATGDKVYVGDSDGLQILDVTNPANPVRIGTCGSRDWAGTVAIDQNFVYLTAQTTLDIIDVSTPELAHRIGDFNTGGTFVGAAAVGNIGYAADSSSGVYVLDLSNPTNPIVVNEIAEKTWALSVANNKLYLANEAAGCQIFDISNPAVPSRLGGFDTTGHVYSVSAAGNLAFAADNHAGMKIFDVTLPSSAFQVGSVTGVVTGVAAVGTYAYVAAGSLQIFDVSVPSNSVRRYASGSIGAESLMIKDRNAYVACTTFGVQRFDISNPANAVKTASYQYTLGFAPGIFAAGTNVYACEGVNGFDIFDDTNPSSWSTPTNYNTKGFAEKAALMNNYAVIADGSNGIVILQIAGFAGEPPRIVTSPASRTVATNSSTTFRVMVQGAEPLSYQWKHNGTDLAGATLSSLSLSNVTANDAGNYSVTVANANGSAASTPAVLEILSPPQFFLSGTNGPVRSGNSFRIRFSTQPSVSYAVEYKNELEQSWQLLRYVAGDGSITTITNSSATAAHQFYRLNVR